jgi:integrase
MTTTKTTARAPRSGTLVGDKSPLHDANKRRYWRGKIRLQDGSRVNVQIPKPKRYSRTASIDSLAWQQQEEDRTHAIFLRKQKGEAAREAAGGTTGDTPSAAWSIATYQKHFFKTRRALGRVEDVTSEEGRLKHLSALDTVAMGALTTPAYRAAIIHMRDHAKRPDGTPLAPRSVINVHRAFALMFRNAVADGVVPVNPCVLRPGDLPASTDKDPNWRKTARFSREELHALISDDRIPEDRRTFWAILFFGCTRFGEASALRWEHLDSTTRPLGTLTIAKSFSTKKRAEKTTKTAVVRYMPVLPQLASILAAWKATGWKAMMGRDPLPGDLIVPSREGKNRNCNHMLVRFREDCEKIGIRARRQHDTRRTFISLAREGGAGDLLRWVTHGPPGEIIDMYTSPSWAKLCSEVLCFDHDSSPVHKPVHFSISSGIPSGANSGSWESGRLIHTTLKEGRA